MLLEVVESGSFAVAQLRRLIQKLGPAHVHACTKNACVRLTGRSYRDFPIAAGACKCTGIDGKPIWRIIWA